MTTDDIAARTAHLTEATTRLLDALPAVPPEVVRSPSRLPDWTVGHVLTHIARNAAAQRNLLHWAATGEKTPMYPSPEARNADIEAGATREPVEILEDVRVSASELSAAIDDLPAEAWSATIDTGRGGPVAADVVLDQRLAEVELHHHDLGIDAGLELLSEEAGARLLAAVLRTFVRTRGVVGVVLEPDGGSPVLLGGGSSGDGGDGDRNAAGGDADAAELTRVRGSAVGIAGWLTGRTDGSELNCDGPLPDLPTW